jgi:hypothetical protein
MTDASELRPVNEAVPFLRSRESTIAGQCPQPLQDDGSTTAQTDSQLESIFDPGPVACDVGSWCFQMYSRANNDPANDLIRGICYEIAIKAASVPGRVILQIFHVASRSNQLQRSGNP